MSRSEKLTQFVIVVCISAILTAIGNIMDGKHVFSDSLLGVAILAGIATIGAVISSLPYANKFPMVFWVSLVGVLISLPGMPGQPWVIEKTSHITFLATTTPVLAYAGLSLGKDLDAFRRLSWRIIPLAGAEADGSFICATVLAQIVLHLEGLI